MTSSASSQRLRGLFLGCGFFAPIQLSAWKGVPNVEIVGLAGRHTEAVDRLCREFQIPRSAATLEELLRHEKPDFIDICSSVGSHAAQIRTAAEHGIPVLCQKPISATLEEAREAVAVCAARNVPLVVNDNWRWQPWYRELRRLLVNDTIGRVFSVYHTLRTGDGWGEAAYRDQPYFRSMPRLLLLETGIHYLDTYRFLFGEPDQLSCHIGRCNPTISGEDQAVIVLQYHQGPIVIWDANRAAATSRVKPPFNGLMRVEGEKGTIEIDGDGGIVVTERGTPTRPQTHPYSIPAGYRGGSVQAALAHFAAGLRGEVPFESTGADYLKTMALVFSAYECAEKSGARTMST